MIRVNNYTTILLMLIVIILLVGLGVALYYVLDLDWFDKVPDGLYNEIELYDEGQDEKIKIQKEIKYDMAKRTYNILLNTNELKLVIYKDGTVGLTMLENKKYENISSYNELLNKEVKMTLTNIIRAYEVYVSEGDSLSAFIVLLDSEGNLYKFVEKELIANGIYAFKKIEGLAKIIDIRQITNDSLTENITGINAIAIDEESNELLITEYLIKNNE